MTIGAQQVFQRQFRAILTTGALTGLTDDQLLERFAAGREGEADLAFAVIVERHGPMVLRICQSTLHDSHDAEDAFQATFLVLVHRSRMIRKWQSLGPWLHGVALRVAACARRTTARRRAHEHRWAERQPPVQLAAAADHLDLGPVIHEEIERLPERFRAPIVLCDVEALSLDDAARQLGWPLGTVKSRLNRGRRLLRDRLLRRGLAPGLVGTALSGLNSSVSSAGSEGLFEATVRVALLTATAQISVKTGAVSATVTALVHRVARALLTGKFKTALMHLMILGLITVGAGVIVAHSLLGAGRQPSTDNLMTPAHDPRTPPELNALQHSPAKSEAKTKVAIRRLPREDGTSLVPITITGHAKDEAGKPVAGAIIYVMNANNGRNIDDPVVLATARSGADGRFVIQGMELPVLKPGPRSLSAFEEGFFQVAGTAQGFGFTWREVRGFRPSRRPATKDNADPDGGRIFYKEEPIRIDLVFGQPATLRGRVIDDHGKPLAGVPVQAGYCDDPRRPEGYGMSNCLRVDPAEVTTQSAKRSFNAIGSLPEAVRSTRTGPDGTYRIEGLPREAQLLTLIDPGSEYDPLSESIATTRVAIQGVRSLGYDGVLDHTFQSPVEARFRVKHAGTNQPAVGVTVRAKSDRTMLRGGGVGVTDADGRATLRLRPGDYSSIAEPAFGSLDLPAHGSFRVEKGLVSEFADVVLPQGAAVVIEAVDTQTKAGVEGVGVDYETDTTRQRQELRSQAVVLDHPRTDETGRLRAVVEPGSRRFIVATCPQGWKPLRNSSELLNLAAGVENKVRFEFQKSEVAKASETAGKVTGVFPRTILDEWQRQRKLPRSGMYRIRRSYIRSESIPRADLESFLDATDLSMVPDPVAALQARFPDLPASWETSGEIIESGQRRRNTWFQSRPKVVEIALANGAETVSYSSVNAQADLFDSGENGLVAVLGASSFSFWPDYDQMFPSTAKSAYASSYAVPLGGMIPAGSRITADVDSANFKELWVVDQKTGFVYVYSLRGKKPRIVEASYRQYGPKTLPNGVILPTVRVDTRGETGMVGTIELTVVEDVDLSYRPSPLDFVLSAPAETLIIDHREDREHPNMGTCHYPVADVLSYAEGMTSRNRLIEPTLKIGQPAPRVQPTAWLDRNGPITPLDLTGKVVLIDFWGITCGPCISQLPEVQAAADRFAGKTKDLVLIGLHESGVTAAELAEFARKRGLLYPLAIDRAEKEEGFFGATFKAYGIRAIPSAAVLDRQGRVAYVGRFGEAIQKAAVLAGLAGK